MASRRGAVEIRSRRHWLWRAVDQHGIVLDILVQDRRDQAAAERLLRQVLDSCEYEPRVVITTTSQLRASNSAGSAKRRASTTQAPEQPGRNSHLPTRKRERVLQRFKSAEHSQSFLVPFSAVCNHFRPRRHQLTASNLSTSAHPAVHRLAGRHLGRSAPMRSV